MSNSPYITAYSERLRQLAEQANKAQVNAPPVPTAPPPLVDQIRNYLVTLPPSQHQRISIPAILPHLQGKYRDHPHLLHVARALKQLGFTPVRSWKKADAGSRYWLAPEQF